MRIGAQLYTVRQFSKTESDFTESIRKVSQIGYTCVQLSGNGNIPLETIRAVCDKHGIEIISTHTEDIRIQNDTDNVIRSRT